ncbi:3'-5' exonuclease [Candidatus Pacearchaeota archaeon]|nr:3'-5' exonuclease [Candidatus Pacearchaeota archaeon]
MIVVDIETSGLSPVKNGIWQIGAINFNNPEEIFFDEGRIDLDDNVSEGALKVTGKTEQELRDKNKQNQKSLLIEFFDWIKKQRKSDRRLNPICQNPQFDIGFLQTKAVKYELEFPFAYRSFDLHSIAATRYFQINGKFLMKEGISGMDLPNVLGLCGLEDERIIVRGEEIIKEGKPHNALEDAKLTTECFSRLVYGKSLFNEFSRHEIPEYLARSEK